EDWSGLVRSAVGFFGLRRSAIGHWLEGSHSSRGYWPVRMGLTTYDWLSGSSSLAPSAAVLLGGPGGPPVGRRRDPGVLVYSDAQMRYPERFVFALLADAVHAAEETRTSLTVHTRTLATIENGTVVLRPHSARWSKRPTSTDTVLQPSLVINATGAWGDR